MAGNSESLTNDQHLDIARSRLLVPGGLEDRHLDEALGKLLPVNFEVNEANVVDYAMLSYINFDHPLFHARRSTYTSYTR